MSTISIKTCIKALHSAALSRKAAFQTELGVSFAVFLMQGGTERTAKQMMVEAYASAGYDCLTPEDQDYKTINRRINATADLFNTIKLRTVKKWAGDTNESELVATMVEGLRPYELHSITDVQRFCEPAAPVRAVPPGTTRVEPHGDILNGPDPKHTGQNKVTQMFRRAADQVKDADKIETEHLHILVPKEATHDELLVLAQQILALAQSRAPVLMAA